GGYLWGGGGPSLARDPAQSPQGRAPPPFSLPPPIANRPLWPNAHAHSAVRIPRTPYVLTADEVYGNYTTPFDIGQQTDGCPWGRVHVINVADPAHPAIAAQYRLRQNHASYCHTPPGQNPNNTDFTSYSTHNPTVLPALAFIAWHSNGLQAVNLADPLHPASAGFFRPAPLKTVATSDPALGRDVSVNKVIMWSYPIINKGLIYVVDIRNGLYILH